MLERPTSGTSLKGTIAGVGAGIATIVLATAVLPGTDIARIGGGWPVLVVGLLATVGIAWVVAAALRGHGLVAATATAALALPAFMASVLLYMSWACSDAGGGPWERCPLS